jgi:1-carboxybiuret hydrolase
MQASEFSQLSATSLAQAVKDGSASAAEITQASLDYIAQHDGKVNAFTDITTERALHEAAKIDALRSSGAALPPLAGVPYAVKNLFDLEGVVTLAGSKVLRSNPPAPQDGFLVDRMKQAGAICVGALNMDEFAYGFTTENSHEGACHNPHDLTRIAGGSSGGCGAAIAAGMVPLSLGSDTNGSIRVPSSLCGIFGLKPTFGRLSRTGSYPFVMSIDHLGPFARSVEDLALSYDACQSPDPKDHFCAQRPFEASMSELFKGLHDLRIARLGGYFDEHATEVAQNASHATANALGVTDTVELPDVAIARAAAFVTTTSEGGALHLPNISDRYEDYEPLSRDRFMSGAMMPSAWYQKAQRFRTLFQQHARALFADYDILIAPATPVQATTIGTEWLDINGKRFPARASIGLLTQPLSFIGLPIVVAPIPQPNGLPIGVQIIAAPWREDLALRVAYYLEQIGLARAPVAQL